MGEIAEPARRGWRRVAQSRRPLDGCRVGGLGPLLRLPTVRERLGTLAGHPLSTVDISRLCFLVGLHDAGKANHGFQARLRRESPDAGHIAPLWGLLAKRRLHRAHRVLYQQVREALSAPRWRAWFGGPDTERDLWGVILAHHGSLPERAAGTPDPRLWRRRGGYDPIAALRTLADAMAAAFPDAFAPENHGPLPTSTRFQHAFAGLVTLADWLGSDETVFPFPSDGAPTGVERVAWSRERAEDVMRRRWLDPTLARATRPEVEVWTSRRCFRSCLRRARRRQPCWTLRCLELVR